MKTIAEVKLEMFVGDILLDITELNTDEMTRSDLQGLCQAEAIKIIELVRKEDRARAGK